MSTREARRDRREAERKSKKLAYQHEKQAAANNQPGFVPSLPQTAPITATAETRATINRANAEHSTGPRTVEGKVQSSRNSFKHGLYSKQLVMDSEDPADLDALKADLRAEHQPATTTEEILVNEMAEQYWRLKRTRRHEARAMNSDDDDMARILPLIGRIMAAAERGFHKALTALAHLQKERNGFVPQSAQPLTEAPVLDIGFELPLAPELGFVPQFAEFTVDSLTEEDQLLLQQALASGPANGSTAAATAHARTY